MLVSLHQVQLQAKEWIEAEDEEAVEEVRHRVAEKVHRGDVIRVMHCPREELLHAKSDAKTEHHAQHSLPERSIDPLEGAKVVQCVRPAKNHADEHEEDRGFVERLIHAQITVSRVVESLKADVFLVVGVDDPVLRHAPSAIDRVVVNQEGDQQPKQEKEEVEFAGSAASHAEAGSQAVAL